MAFFDLYDLFINQICGSSSFFIMGSLALVVVLCAMFRLSNQATMIMVTFYAILISAFFSSILALVLVLIGFFVATALGRLIRVT